MIEELQRFILTVREGNLTRAAEKSFITQSALTQSIQRLERSLGAKLFTLKGKSLRVTDEGKAVFEIGNKIIALWNKAKDPNIRKSLRPVYTIGAFDNAALRLGNFFRERIHSERFDLEIVIDNSESLFSQLQFGIVDMAICVTNSLHTLPKGTTLTKTFKEELLPVSAKEFSGHIEEAPFILYNKNANTRKQIDRVFAEQGIIPQIFAESTSTTFMKELALLGCGVALLPENYVQAELLQKTLIKQKMPFRWSREYGIYLPKQSKLVEEKELLKEVYSHLLDNLKATSA